MSEIVIPGETPPEENDDLKYKATEDDEERFFLMYHLNFQPSEVEALEPNYRKWIIARFMGQKAMEKEMMTRHQMMQQIMPNIKV